MYNNVNQNYNLFQPRNSQSFNSNTYTYQPYQNYQNYQKVNSRPFINQSNQTRNYNAYNNTTNYAQNELRQGASIPFTGASNGIGRGLFSSIGSSLRSPISVPKVNGLGSAGLLSGLGAAGLGSKLRTLSFGSVLGGVQKTVTTINQVIPLYQQAKPIINNGKTIFKMWRAASAINKEEGKTNNEEKVEKEETETNSLKAEESKIIDIIDATPVIKQMKEKELSPKTTPNRPFFVE